MKVSTMRRADRLLGVPICWALTLARRLGDLARSADEGPARRIVFVKPAEQGSTVLAHGAISEAIERVGRENVYFLVFEENRFILDAMGMIPQENVIGIPTKGLLSVLAGGLRAVRRLRKAGVDASVDMEFFARSSAILSYLSGARRRAGFTGFAGEAPYRGDLMTHRVHFNTHLHTSQSFRILVQALDQPADVFPAFDVKAPPRDTTVPALRPTPEEVGEVQAVLREATGRQDAPPLVLLNANASDLLPLRRWPEGRYVELASRLLDKYPDLQIAFTGAPEEAGPLERLAGQVGSERCVVLAGKVTLLSI